MGYYGFSCCLGSKKGGREKRYFMVHSSRLDFTFAYFILWKSKYFQYLDTNHGIGCGHFYDVGSHSNFFLFAVFSRDENRGSGSCNGFGFRLVHHSIPGRPFCFSRSPSPISISLYCRHFIRSIDCFE